MTKIVVGLTGMPRSGKGHLGKKYHGKKLFRGVDRPNVLVKHLAFSDALRYTARRYGIEESRENLQILAQKLDEIRPGAVTEAARQGIQWLLEKHDDILVIVDGVRWITDEQMIRSFPDSMIVFIHADFEARYQRAVAAGENVGDTVKTREQFLADDQAENEKYIPEIGARADYQIENNGAVEQFDRAINKFLVTKFNFLV